VASEVNVAFTDAPACVTDTVIGPPLPTVLAKLEAKHSPPLVDTVLAVPRQTPPICAVTGVGAAAPLSEPHAETITMAARGVAGPLSTSSFLTGMCLEHLTDFFASSSCYLFS
jgi:hypothetical protein